MSVTDDERIAEKRCLMDEEDRKYEDIELLEIETTGSGWCHPVMSMFKAQGNAPEGRVRTAMYSR